MAITVRTVTDANEAFTSSTANTVEYLELRGTNGPDGRVFQIVQFNGGGGYGWQFACGTDHYNLYKRHCAGGTWTPWTRFWPPLRIVGGVRLLLNEALAFSRGGARHEEHHQERLGAGYGDGRSQQCYLAGLWFKSEKMQDKRTGFVREAITENGSGDTLERKLSCLGRIGCFRRTGGIFLPSCSIVNIWPFRYRLVSGLEVA